MAAKSESVPRRTQLLFFPSLDPIRHANLKGSSGHPCSAKKDTAQASSGLLSTTTYAPGSVDWEEGVSDKQQASGQPLPWQEQISYYTIDGNNDPTYGLVHAQA